MQWERLSVITRHVTCVILQRNQSLCLPHRIRSLLQGDSQSRNMSNAQLIRRMLKRVCQVLAALTTGVATSSAQRLRILLSCFRCFMAKIRTLSRRNICSRSFESAPESYTVASSAWCPQVTLPLPLHNGQITSAPAANSTHELVPSSPCTIPVPSTPQIEVTPSRTSLHAEVNNAIPSNGSRATANFIPVGAGDNSRYDNRQHAYVVAALYYNSGQS